MEGRPICKFFKMGDCRKGNACTFAHRIDTDANMSDNQMTKKLDNEPRICQYFLEGNCKNQKCHSIHGYSNNLDHVILDDEFHTKPIIGMCQISNRLNNIKILPSS